MTCCGPSESMSSTAVMAKAGLLVWPAAMVTVAGAVASLVSEDPRVTVSGTPSAAEMLTVPVAADAPSNPSTELRAGGDPGDPGQAVADLQGLCGRGRRRGAFDPAVLVGAEQDEMNQIHAQLVAKI